jgi:hypothetical protein
MLTAIVATVIVVGLCFLVFVNSGGINWYWMTSKARRQGALPAPGKETMYDVRRLLLQGEKDLATLVYCKIFRTSRREAKKAVEELDKSLSGKKLG